MTRDSERPKNYKPKPVETDVLLKKELQRRGMSEKEIADTLRKKKRQKPLEFAVVQSRHALPMEKARKAPVPKAREPVRRISDELCTVEFAAERLKVHPKTILRFIRKGTLTATRIGKSYRIRRSDLENLAGVPLPAPRDEASMTSIVDVPDVDAPLAQKWSSTITGALNARGDKRASMRAEIIHDPERAHLKIVVVGPPNETVNLLSLIRLWLDQLRA